MKKFLALCICVNVFSGFSHAQIIGSDTVCAGYIYNYNINVPGAASYIWTVPAGWYELSGQGTSQISVTCNINPGSVCVESFDSNLISLGAQCLSTNFGSDGSANYHLEPTGNNPVCDGNTSFNIVPTLVYDGPGGGGCLPGCGNGIQHPNIVWGIYEGLIFKGVVGSLISCSVWGNYTLAHVDITNGSNFPQAIEISGCGGTITGSFSFQPINFYATTWMTPSNVCVGDTFWLHGNGGPCSVSFGGPFWGQFSNLIPLTTDSDAYQIQVVAIGTPVNYFFSTCIFIQGGVFDGNHCWSYVGFTRNVFNVPESNFIPDTSSLCSNNCINFSNFSTNADFYTWSFPGANPSSSADSFPGLVCYPNAGIYDVTLVASNAGCSDTLTIPSAINVAQSPQNDFSVSQSNLCPGSCIDFYNQSTNGSAFLWNFQGAAIDSSTEENPVLICYPYSGYFDVTLISTNGNCSDTLVVPQYISVYPAPPPVSILQSADTLFASTGFSSYVWYLNGNIISGATESYYVCISNGDYNVVATDTNGCEVEAAINNVLTILTPAILDQQDFVVYPNPAQDVLEIILPASFAFTVNATLLILNFQNRIVLAASLNNLSIAVDQLSEGMYFIQIVGDKEVLRTSFLKVE